MNAQLDKEHPEQLRQFTLGVMTVLVIFFLFPKPVNQLRDTFIGTVPLVIRKFLLESLVIALRRIS